MVGAAAVAGAAIASEPATARAATRRVRWRMGSPEVGVRCPVFEEGTHGPGPGLLHAGNWFAEPRPPPVALSHVDPDVAPLCTDPARGPRRRRGPEPPAAGARGLHPPGGARHLHLAAPRAEGAAP